MQEIVVELIKIVPSLLWFFLLMVVLVLFYNPLKMLLANLKMFKAMGVEVSFVRDSIDAALRLAEKSPKWKVHVPQEAKDRVIARARMHLDILKNAQLLWVDDIPENNRNELRMLQQMRVQVDTVTSTRSALELLQERKYDAIISDMERESDAQAGLKFLERLRRKDSATPVIFYIGAYDKKRGIPPLSFGITNRPDELLHLILDALERKKY